MVECIYEDRRGAKNADYRRQSQNETTRKVHLKKDTPLAGGISGDYNSRETLCNTLAFSICITY